MSKAIEAKALTKRYPPDVQALERARSRGRRGDDLRAARPERRRQVDDGEDPDHAHPARLGRGERRGPRRPEEARPRPPFDRRRRAEARLRSGGDRQREPRAPGRDLRPGRAGAEGPRRRAARAVQPDRRGPAAGQDVLRRHAAPTRHCDGPAPSTRRALPRRADDRPRPGGASRHVGGDRTAREGGEDDDPAHDALSGRGRRARGPGRDRRPRPHRRRTGRPRS